MKVDFSTKNYVDQTETNFTIKKFEEKEIKIDMEKLKSRQKNDPNRF